jgi:hypothetical protein
MGVVGQEGEREVGAPSLLKVLEGTERHLTYAVETGCATVLFPVSSPTPYDTYRVRRGDASTLRQLHDQERATLQLTQALHSPLPPPETTFFMLSRPAS